MTLTTEELPAIENVTAEGIERVLSQDAFGKFAILAATDRTFIQAGCLWEPGPECERFQEETGSDPFCLEYRDGEASGLFSADEQLTLAQVTQAFLEYLRGDGSWRTRFNWTPVEF